MTTRSRMQCMVCVHYRSPLDSDDDDAPEQVCDAFPGRIPDEIWGMEYDHRQPYPGDHGIQWQSQGERPYPAEDLVPPAGALDMPAPPPALLPALLPVPPVMRVGAGGGVGWGWDPVELCMPPTVPVPKPGPCPGAKRGVKNPLKSPAEKVEKVAKKVTKPKAEKVAKKVAEKTAEKAAKKTAKVAKAKPMTFEQARQQLKEIYGDRLHITGSSPHISEQVVALAKLPPMMHHTVNRLFTRSGALAGLFIGDGPVTEVSPLGKHLKGVQPRGWGEGKTFDQVAGVFMAALGQIVVGGGPKFPHGSTSLSVHEFGHALDEADKVVAGGHSSSSTEKWRDAIETINASSDLVVNPYYTRTANPGGWLDEAYAEGLAGWSTAADAKDDMAKVNAILDTLTYRKPGREPSEDVVNAVKFMIAQYERLAGR